ncbi:nitroreductase family protein [Micromonospora craniellae]|uniref:Nitroreductase n=1 Tax=Micromonospora craniellae TaxID=2294034 RepID=A0A372FUS3_9ACTN|nr:nitroreductase [Micromonospora craniellae]QOC89778.1 nitroreductase [Micromonospora craniellae]RFS44505.1 nitroreductase [Micromonospora craniellae]
MDVAAFRALEPLCWRAPSAHNTQPWRLRYEPGQIRVGWNPAYALPAADPTGRDLRLSLGAFVETCLIVAADADLPLEYVADHDDPWVGRFRPAPSRYPTPFRTTEVWDRRTHRGGFVGGPDSDALAAVDAVARQAGGSVRTVPHADRLGALLREADRQVYADPTVVAELRRWLRLTPAHPDYRADGLTDRCLGLSRPAANGLRAALAAYPALRRLGLPRLLAAADDPLARGGDVLVLVAPVGLDRTGQVEFGRVLLRCWLTLHAAGSAAHPLSQLVDVAATRTALGTLLDVAPDRLLHVTRVGRPTRPAPRSARRVTGSEHPSAAPM